METIIFMKALPSQHALLGKKPFAVMPCFR